MTPEEIAVHERHIRAAFGPKIGAFALARRDWWMKYLRQDLGLLQTGVDIPPPIVTDGEYTLRTRLGPIALFADDVGGRINVFEGSAVDLSTPHGRGGGRASDPVEC